VLEDEEDPDRFPFDLDDDGTKTILEKAVQHGHKVYFVSIVFNEDLGRYYNNPKTLIDNFFSVGTIAEAMITSGNESEGNTLTIKHEEPDQMTELISGALTDSGVSNLDLLVTSILEFDLFSIAIEIDKSRIRLLHKETIFGTAPAPEVSLEQRGDRPAEKQPKKAPESEEGLFYIRLDITVINSLLDLANEMILTRNQLFSSISGYEKIIAGLPPILHDLNRLTSEIQEKVMYTRMQPISVVFSKFPRIIRDTAKSLGKEIIVDIPNNDVTLDKYLLEALTDPITQIIKNSADHGLESTQRRIELGKPPKGVITLDAYMRDGSAIIEVKDDGAGIDAEALKNKALDRGLVTAEMLAVMSRNDIFNLIFEPGISTATKITNYSGRGVGMDIVKTNIENLGGSIEIESEVDVGTTIRLKVPLTLSVTRSLIVTMDSINYAVPELNVERIVRIWSGNKTRRIEKVNNSLVLCLDGRFIPVITIHDIEGKARGTDTMPADELLKQINDFGVVKCLVLKAGGRCFALMIDDALETEQVLVKPLPIYLHSCMCYSNVTVLGSGQAVMILDADGIMRFMDVSAIEDEAIKTLSDGFETESTDDEAVQDVRQVMLFTCSGSEYYAVDIEDISRIEDVNPENIQLIGRGSFINIADETIRIIRPEDYSPVRKYTYTDRHLYLIKLKRSKAPLGLLVRKVIDKVDDVFILDEEQIHNEFVTGTSAYNEKVLIFLDTDAIAEDVDKKKGSKKPGTKGGSL
jgi:two-component system chemotaxis sensor kinase CheA